MPATYRNPYTIGGWVSGQRYYGHVDLRQYILLGSDNYIWIIGSRRIGKTSLLRQLDIQGRKHYLPIYWDMQGCASPEDLRDELLFALEDRGEVWANLGIDTDQLAQEDMANVLRKVCRQSQQHQARVLLLIDEPEPLIELAQKKPQVVQRLRAAFQRPPNLRVVLASTKTLITLQDLSRDWPTSPFLSDFAPFYLDGLEPQEAEQLIRQEQRHPVQVSAHAIRRIHDYTGDHPYLLQWLCYHLYHPDHSLRPPTRDDVVLDTMLTSLFQLQFHQLSPTERRILLHLAEHPGTEEQIAAALGQKLPETRMYLYLMGRLGYTRPSASGRIIPGNAFLHRWLIENMDQLSVEDAPIPDHQVQQMARAGLKEEVLYWQDQLRIYQDRLGKLELTAAKYGDTPPERLQETIRAHQRQIRALQRKIDAFHKTFK